MSDLYRIMSIDYGEARIGIALSDPLKIIANGYKTLKNDDDILKSIYDICKDKDVEGVVIGIPYDENSNIGISAKKVIKFAKSLSDYFIKNKLNIMLYEQDERYTTDEAYNAMKMMNVKKKRKKEIVDQIAAAKILSDFLKSNKKNPIEFNDYDI